MEKHLDELARQGKVGLLEAKPFDCLEIFFPIASEEQGSERDLFPDFPNVLHPTRGSYIDFMSRTFRGLPSP